MCKSTALHFNLVLYLDYHLIYMWLRVDLCFAIQVGISVSHQNARVGILYQWEGGGGRGEGARRAAADGGGLPPRVSKG